MFQVDAGVGNAYQVCGDTQYVPPTQADHAEHLVGLAAALWGVSVLRFHLEDEAWGSFTRSNFYSIGQARRYSQALIFGIDMGVGE